MGALGCATADLLARAGVGLLTLVDRDVVEASNLQRQVLFSEQDARDALPKTEAAATRLRGVNSAIEILPIVADVHARNVGRVLGLGARPAIPTVLIDGTDNFEARFLLNDLAVKLGLAFLYAGVVGTRATRLTILPAGVAGSPTPCLRCVFDAPPPPGSSPTCDTAGVLGPAVGVIAAHQAAEALKVLLGRHERLDRALLEVDPWTNLHRRIDVGVPRPDCPCCAQQRFEFLDAPEGADHAALCGQDAVQLSPRAGACLDLDDLARRWVGIGEVTRSRFMVRLRPGDGAGSPGGVSPIELTVFHDARAIVRGTTRPEVARSVYARFVGA